jgi:hypothetical protein
MLRRRMVPGMGTVTSIDSAQGSRLAAISAVAARHPALRYLSADADEALAHRRTPMGRTVCDLDGPLFIADTVLPLCDACYRGRVG